MATKHRFWVLFLAAVSALESWGGLASASDLFLDRTIPAPSNNKSYLLLDRLDALQPVIGKKVIFPPGFVDFVSREKLRPACLINFGPDKKKFTIRDYLNGTSQESADLTWKYDEAQDAVIFDFAWRLPVSHPGRELVDQLGKLSPLPMNQLPESSARKLDTWRLALNELMSEPENFPHAWKVRLEDGCTNWLSLANSRFFGDDGVHAHILKDADGKEHLLVLNYHEPLMTPGPNPSITYYLFAADGQWEDGGRFEAGTIFTPPAIKFEPDKNRATIEVVDHPLEFMTKNGPEIVNPNRPIATYDFYLKINRGKLTASFLKNGSPLSPTDYAIGVTPLHHLGD
jgi:hypothetical protein